MTTIKMVTVIYNDNDISSTKGIKAQSLKVSFNDDKEAKAFLDLLKERKDFDFSFNLHDDHIYLYLGQGAINHGVSVKVILDYLAEYFDLPSHFLIDFPVLGNSLTNSNTIELPLSCSKWIKLELTDLLTKVEMSKLSSDLSTLIDSNVSVFLPNDKTTFEITCNSPKEVFSIKKRLSNFALRNEVDDQFHFEKIPGVVAHHSHKFLIKVQEGFNFYALLERLVSSNHSEEKKGNELA